MKWETVGFDKCSATGAQSDGFKFRIYRLDDSGGQHTYVMYISKDGKAYDDFRGIESDNLSRLKSKAESLLE